MSLQQRTIADQSGQMDQWELRGRFGGCGEITASHISAPSSRADRRAPVWLFIAGGERVVCRRPVEIEVHRLDGEVLVSCERLHVFASGADYDQAMQSLHEQVVHFCKEYQSLRHDDVIGPAVQIRELYTKYFEVEPSR